MTSPATPLIGVPPDAPQDAEGLPTLVLPRPALGAWLGGVTLGEVLGFTTTALVAWVGLALGGHPETVTGRVVALLVMGLAGTIEGGSLGYFQWRVLRRWLPDLSGLAYIGSTAAVAAVGWLVGMSVPLVMTLNGTINRSVAAPAGEPSAIAIGLFAAGFGALAGALFGLVQSRAFVPHVRGSWRWILGNIVGWAVGLPCSYAAGSMGTADMTVWHALALSAAGGAGMGVSVALATFVATRGMVAVERKR